MGRRRGVPTAVAFPLAWTAVEWLRSFGDLGFTWAVAGDTLAAFPLLIQSAELGGVWLLTLWVTGLSAALYRLARPLPATRRARLAVLALALAAALPAYPARSGFGAGSTTATIRVERCSRTSHRGEWDPAV